MIDRVGKRLPIIILLLVFASAITFYLVNGRKLPFPKLNSGSQPQSVKGNISVSSQMNDYDLQIKNRELLDKKLEEIGFWKDGGVANYATRTIRLTAKVLTVTLASDVPDPFSAQTDLLGKEIVKVSAKVDEGGKVLIDISVDPNMEISPTSSLSDFFDFAFWKGVYVVTKFQGQSTTKVDGGKADDFAIQMLKDGNQYFEIIKK